VLHPVIPILAQRGDTQLQVPRPTILVHTREQNPFNFSRFPGWFAGIELPLSDYSVTGLKDLYMVEYPPVIFSAVYSYRFAELPLVTLCCRMVGRRRTSACGQRNLCKASTRAEFPSGACRRAHIEIEKSGYSPCRPNRPREPNPNLSAETLRS